MLQQVEHSSCIRCLDFETSDGMSFGEQKAALFAHLNEKHPGWQTDGGASILERRLPKAEKDRIVDLERQLADCAEHTDLAPHEGCECKLCTALNQLESQLAEMAALKARAEAAEAQVKALSAPVTEEEMHAVYLCACAYCMLAHEKIIAARLAATQKGWK